MTILSTNRLSFLKKALTPFQLKSFVIMALFVLAFSSHAATITSNAVVGNWNATTTWVGGALPAAGDDVVITVGATVTINQAVTCVNLTVDGALTTDAANRVVTINGALVVNGSFDIFRCNPLTIIGSTTVNGTITDTDNNGSTILQGLLSINPSGSFSPTSTSAFTFQNGIVNNGILNKTGTGANTFNANVQIIGGANPINLAGAITNGIALTINTPVTFGGVATINAAMTINSAVTFSSTSTLAAIVTFNAPVVFTGNSTANANQSITSPVTFSGAVTIANGITITNQSQAIIGGVLNGATGSTTATWKNDVNSTLDYRSATVPMALGILDVASSGNTFNYNGDTDQTIKAVSYYNLQTGTNGGSNNRNKTIESLVGSMTIGGNLQIGNRSVFYLGLGAKNISVTGNVTLENATTWLRTNNTDNVIHSLTIAGYLITNGGEVRLRYDNATRYCDLNMTGSGDIIQGSGTVFYLRNLTLTNASTKTSSYTGSIDFYAGASGNAFTNDGGSFTATAGGFRFLDAFSIGGTGSLFFNNLQCGNNNQTVQLLGNDITVNGVLTLNHNNTASSSLNINGKSLTVVGGFTRANSGEMSGTALSSLLFGNGGALATSGSVVFESGAQLLGLLRLNTSSSIGLGSSLSVADLTILSGTLTTAQNFTITNSWANNGAYVQTALTTYFNKPSGTISFTGSGANTIQTLEITDGTLDFASDITINAGFVNNSNASVAFNQTTGTTSFASTGAQSINTGTGVGTVTFYNLTATGGNTKTASRVFSVANQLTVNDATTFSLGVLATTFNVGGAVNLSGTGTFYAGTGASIINLNGNVTIDGTLHFGTTTAKTISIGGDLMDATGAINMSGTGLAHTLNLSGINNANSALTTTASSGSTVNFNRNGDQQVLLTPNYQNLTVSGSGIKSLVGSTTVNGNISVLGTSVLNLNSNTLNALGNTTISNGATLEVDDNAQLLVANTKVVTNNGTLKVVGSSGNPAIVSRNGATGGYSIDQSSSGAIFEANNYQFNYLSGGIAISNGTINSTNNFSNGSFSNGTGSQYLLLTGANLTGLPNVTNVTFNLGPSANVTRTSGTGAIVFDNASGVFAGENFDVDNGNPGSFVIWSYPASVYYSTGNVSAGLTTSWAKNTDGSGGSPSSVTDGLNTLVVQDGHTVTIDSNGNLDVKNLQIGQGTSGSMVIGATSNQQTLTIRENLDVKSGASLLAGSSGSPSHNLLVYGNLYNEGTINLKPSTGIVVNTSLYGIMVVSGTSIPHFNDVTFRTGSSATATVSLDINGNVAIETGATFNDGGLTHNVAGNWSLTSTGVYNASGTIVFDGMVNTINDNTSGTSVSFNNVTFNGAGAGSLQENVVVNGNLLITNNTILQTALNLTANGNFTIDNGSTYTQTANTTTFGSANTQAITLNGSNSFYNATFSNGGGNAKTIDGNMTVANFMTLSSGATLAGTGVQTIYNGARIDGTCNLSGVLIMKGGSLTTGNASSQIVLGTAELRIDGNVYLTVTAPATANNLIMANDLNILNGFLVLNANTQVIGDASHRLKVDATKLLYVRGADNFPTGFGTIDLSSTSTVLYDAVMAQTVRGNLTYGHLTLGGGILLS